MARYDDDDDDIWKKADTKNSVKHILKRKSVIADPILDKVP